MIKLKKIDWISEEIKEAELHLTDGSFNLNCFSHPFDTNTVFSSTTPLYVFCPYDIYKNDNKEEFSVKKNGDNYFGYELACKVVSKENSRVRLGDFLLELDIDLPNDIIDNDFILFKCERIDVY